MTPMSLSYKQSSIQSGGREVTRRSRDLPVARASKTVFAPAVDIEERERVREKEKQYSKRGRDRGREEERKRGREAERKEREREREKIVD